jgi:hypothetical protein
MSKHDKTNHISKVIHEFETFLKLIEPLSYSESDSIVDTMKKAAQRAKLMPSIYENSFRNCVNNLKNAVKFRLPENGSIMQDVTKDKTFSYVINNFLFQQHLPFPSIALEFNTNGTTSHGHKYRASIIYAEEVKNKNDERSIIQLTIIKHVQKVKNAPSEWSALKYIVEIDFNKVDSNTQKYSDFIRILDWDAKDTYSRTEEAILANSKHEIDVLLQFLLALSCKNVNVAQEYPPSVAANKKRAEKGHPLEYQYNTITINTNSNNSQTSKSIGHSNPNRTVSPHLRRGHIRRYENKNIWVESTVVKADQSNGLKAKQYIVK